MNLRNKLAAGVAALSTSGLALAQATTPIEDIFAAVSFGTVTTAVVTAGIAVVGIRLAYKGIDLAKRAVGKA